MGKNLGEWEKLPLREICQASQPEPVEIKVFTCPWGKKKRKIKKKTMN